MEEYNDDDDDDKDDDDDDDDNEEEKEKKDAEFVNKFDFLHIETKNMLKRKLCKQGISRRLLFPTEDKTPL